jgi:hypothetical protein
MTPTLKKLLTLTIALAETPKESAEADAIRDEMDAPWRETTPEERRIVQRLSADLCANLANDLAREVLAEVLGVDPSMIVVKP